MCTSRNEDALVAVEEEIRKVIQPIALRPDMTNGDGDTDAEGEERSKL